MSKSNPKQPPHKMMSKTCHVHGVKHTTLPVCCIDDCHETHHSRGHCLSHYRQNYYRITAPNLKARAEYWIPLGTREDRIFRLIEPCYVHGTKHDIQKTCCADGCPKRHQSRGCCSMHARRVRIHGDIHIQRIVQCRFHQARHPWRDGEGCCVPGCNREYRMNGVCQTHESIGKRLGEIPSSYYDLNNPPKCAWDGCDELAPRRANVIGDKSLCQRHRHRLKQYGPGFLYVDYLVLLEQQDGLCALPNCWRPMVEGDDDIDHDHDQGHVRGLMCRNHNRQFGHVEALVAENFGNDIHAFVVWVEDYVKESKAA